MMCCSASVASRLAYRKSPKNILEHVCPSIRRRPISLCKVPPPCLMIKVTRFPNLPPRNSKYTQYLKMLVPKTIPSMAFGTRVLKYWVLGSSGSASRAGHESQPERPGALYGASTCQLPSEYSRYHLKSNHKARNNRSTLGILENKP